MAVRLEEAGRCVMCGTADWEWAEDPNAYQAVPVACPGCAVRETEQESEAGKQKRPGVSVQLLPRDLVAEVTSKARRPRSARERARERA